MHCLQRRYMRLYGIILLVLARPLMAADPPGFVLWPKGTPPVGAVTRPIWGNHLMSIVRRNRDAGPEAHVRQSEIWVVQSGEANLLIGGELAYEVNVDASYGHYMWESLMEAGAEFDITPYGTETMHVLRAEKGFIIVGQDTDGSVSPIDLGMGWAVSMKKSFAFLGKRSLARADTARLDRKQ